MSKNTRDYEWSSISDGNLSGEAWLEDFYAGDVMDSSKSEFHHVRCVRGKLCAPIYETSNRSPSMGKKHQHDYAKKLLFCARSAEDDSYFYDTIR